MSTRGTIGFRMQKKDKVTYNHSDSYPSWLGINILSFIKDTPEPELKDIASRIELVDEDSTPSPEQIEAYSKYSDTSVSTRTKTDWYCLLRDTQGDLNHYRSGVRHMIDYHEFLKDSLSCEWAYIINIDSRELEIYRGYNKQKNLKNGGRYAKYTVDEDKRYYGVTILATLSLSDIRNMTEEAIKVYCQALEEAVYTRTN